MVISSQANFFFRLKLPDLHWNEMHFLKVPQCTSSKALFITDFHMVLYVALITRGKRSITQGFVVFLLRWMLLPKNEFKNKAAWRLLRQAPFDSHIGYFKKAFSPQVMVGLVQTPWFLFHSQQHRDDLYVWLCYHRSFTTDNPHIIS